MTARAGWLPLLLLLAVTNASAERLPIRLYSTADGLAHNTIRKIVRDSRGFLWFCTIDGLSRFDGYAFRTFGAEHGLPHAEITDLLETKDGEFWAATAVGLVHVGRISASSPTVIRLVEARGAPTQLPLIVPANADRRSRSITVLRQTRDGTIWVGTGNGLFRLRVDAGVASLVAVDIGLPPPGNPELRIISALLEDRHGTLWIGTPFGVYRRWADGSAARHVLRQDLPREFVSDLLEDREGRLWISTRNAGVYEIHTDATRSPPGLGRMYSIADGLPNPWVTQLFESAEGRIWIATATGVAELLPPGPDGTRQLNALTARQGLTSGYISAIGEDLAGNIWFGSALAGAMRLSRGGFTTFGVPESISEAFGVFEDRAGHLCARALVLTDGQGNVLHGKRLELVRTKDPAPDYRFGCVRNGQFTWVRPQTLTLWGWVHERVTLQARNGEWWIGTHDGVLRYPPTPDFTALDTTPPLALYRTTNAIEPNQILALFEDSRGDVWISSIATETRGLSRFDRRTGRMHDMAGLPGLPSLVGDLPRSMAEDHDGNVWFGFNDGLARYANGAFTLFTARHGLPPGAIRAMHVDRAGRLWLASEQSGLVRVDRPATESPSFVSYTTADGLSSMSLLALTEDRDGFLYLGSGRGLDRFDTSRHAVRQFTATDGLTPGLIVGAHGDANGAVWFGTSNGLVRLTPAEPTDAAPPPVLISALRIRGITQQISPFGEREISMPDLASDHAQVEVEFVGLGFGLGEVLRYQYRLEGADADWSAPTSRRTVTYANLAPADYTFRVRAIDADGVTTPRPAAIHFVVLRPFWQRWWFIAGAIALAALALTLGFRYRLARLLEVANMRTHIATDLHDDIGANLTRIALLSEVAKRTKGDGPLESIATIARESSGTMSDIVWAVNPKRESLQDLTRRMRQHAEELFTQRGVQLRFAGPQDDGRRLDMDVRRDVLLVFKEAVNNAARHSRCTAVDVALVVDDGRLVLTVADDGVGFDQVGPVEGNGLDSMRRRGTRLRGSLTIEGREPSGTRITLMVPL